MRGLLIRVGVDQSKGGGGWNAPVDRRRQAFAYVPIPESSAIRNGYCRPYSEVSATLATFNQALPAHLLGRNMHLDPDFQHLTYGDQGSKARQIYSKLVSSDLLAFFAGLRDVHEPRGLVYALIGLYVIDALVPATAIPESGWHENAHTRRVLAPGAGDVVVRARPGVSGRLERCVPIGDYRNGAYRVRAGLLREWGGLKVKDGYLQRSARPPEFLDAAKFYQWFQQQEISLVARNN